MTKFETAFAEWQEEAGRINRAIERNQSETRAAQQRVAEAQRTLAALRTQLARLYEQRDAHGRNRPEEYYTKSDPYCIGDYPTYHQPEGGH